MLEELIVELIDKGFITDINASNGELERIIEKYRDKWKVIPRKRFHHKKLNIIGEVKDDGHLHYERCSGNICSVEAIHMDFIYNSCDWEEVLL